MSREILLDPEYLLPLTVYPRADKPSGWWAAAVYRVARFVTVGAVRTRMAKVELSVSG
jgi:hypothetical protein